MENTELYLLFRSKIWYSIYHNSTNNTINYAQPLQLNSSRSCGEKGVKKARKVM
jgi:hypothetical protein